MTATNPAGGAAIPVSIDTTRRVKGGAAIPVYGYASAPTDGRPAQGGAAQPVRVLTAADLKQNGGMWTLEGRPYALPVYTAPATARVMGGPAIAVYPINAWPPSNAVPAWAPTDIAGLALWLKSDVGLFQDAAKTTPAVADADPIGAWADQSGNGRDLVQSTAGKRPLLKLNQQNGKAAVLLDGSDDFMVTGAFALNQPTTIYLVLKQVAWTPGANVTGTSDGNYNLTIQQRTLSPKVVTYAGAFGATIDGPAIGAFGIITAVFNGANGSMRLNGGAATVGNDGGNNASGFSLGHLNDPVVANVAFGEILVYSGTHNVTQQSNVLGYLNTRWIVY